MPRHAGDRDRASRRARLIALAVCAIALPPVLVESAGSAGPRPASGPEDTAASARPDPRADDKAGAAAAAEPSPPGAHLSTAVRCGPRLSSPVGVEAQTCVVAQGAEVRARTYYRNTTGERQIAVLSLLGPGNRTVLTRCAVDTGDEPALCETPRERARGALARYAAVAEFAARAGGRLLLRSGSN